MAVSEHLLACDSAPSKLTLSALCSATGLGRNTIYGQFESVAAAERYVADQALASVTLELVSDTTAMTPLDAVSTFAGTWADRIVEQPLAYRVALRWARPVLLARLRQAVAPVLQLGIAAGLFAPDPSGLREPALLEALLAVGERLSESPSGRDTAASFVSSLITKLCR